MLRSKYFDSLPKDAKKRYEEKLKYINDQDPYCLKDNSLSIKPVDFPALNYFSIINYFIYKKSPFSDEDSRCYKGIEAFKFVTAEKIRKIGALKFENNYLLKGKVEHSQKLNDKLLEPWAIIENTKTDIEILCGHCTCMAGLGEKCSHLGALLFYAEKLVREYVELPCTSKPVQWKPGSKKSDVYGKLSDLDFTPPHKKFFSQQEAGAGPASKNSTINKEIPAINDEEMLHLFQDLENAESRCPLMKLTDCSGLYSPKEEVPDPVALKRKDIVDRFSLPVKLYDESKRDISLDDLIKIDVMLNLTEEDVKCIEEMTRNQKDDPLWFALRAGRVTASNFKRSTRTSLTKPALSLLKGICYPEKNKADSKAIRYGHKYEHTAYLAYQNQMKLLHKNFKLRKSGLILNSEFPQFGASPDGIVSCDCCGEGVLEIKCPESLETHSFTELPSIKKDFCLKDNKLDTGHAYFFQVQMQIFITKSKYSDFVVWSPHEPLHWERIFPNEAFWEIESFKATEFYRNCIVPELVARYFTIRNEKSQKMEMAE